MWIDGWAMTQATRFSSGWLMAVACRPCDLAINAGVSPSTPMSTLPPVIAAVISGPLANSDNLSVTPPAFSHCCNTPLV